VAGGRQLFEHGKRAKRPCFIAGVFGRIEMCDVAHESETERLVSDYDYFTPGSGGDATIFRTSGCVFLYG
jgi:hypothetical protein